MVKTLKSPYTEKDDLYDATLNKYLMPKEKALFDIFIRMAKAVQSRINPDQLLWAFCNGLMPQGSILYALGNNESKYCSVSNCYFLAIREDSMEGIMDTAKRMAITYKYRGGVGIDLSILRPKGEAVSNSARTSTGAASFMNMYSEITKTIGQHGRRGALMLTIDVDHPDVFDFIKMKQTPGLVEGANVSVKITDAFMKAVKNNQSFDLKWKPQGFEGQLPKVYKTISARELWDQLVYCAWKSAEPGILFWDRILSFGAASCYKELTPKGTNPCSEIPIPDDDACTLASIYVPLMVKNPYQDVDPIKNFDWDKFESLIRIGVKFLDHLKDIDNTPFESQKKIALLGRRIGLGLHGIGDMLCRLKLTYGSPESIKFVEQLTRFLKDKSYSESALLAKEFGPFPLYNAIKEQNCPWVFEGLSSDTIQELKTYGRRNVQLNTIAPTGSISILCNNCSSGIEPIYRLKYTRTTRLGGSNKDHVVYHPELKRYAKVMKLDVDSLSIPAYFIESNSVDPLDRVKMQAAAAKNIDHSISSTVNLPQTSTIDQVSQIMFNAWESGCKGITVYRDKSREGILNPIEIGKIRSRPDSLEALSHNIIINDCSIYLTVTYLEGKPFDIMLNTNNKTIKFEVEDSIFNLKFVCKKYNLMNEFNEQNSKANNQLDLFMRLTSLLLRASIPINEIFNDSAFIVGSLAFHVKRLLKPKDELNCIGGKCN